MVKPTTMIKNGKVIASGHYVDGLVQGTWTFARKRRRSDEVTGNDYIKNRLYNSAARKESGMAHHEAQEKLPMYPGGEVALFVFLGKNLRYDWRMRGEKDQCVGYSVL